MECDKVKKDLKVKTTTLGSTAGMMIGEEYLKNRAAGVTGVVQGYVGGHGGDVWWIKHDGADVIAPYVFTEFEPV